MRHLLTLALFAFTIPAHADMVVYNVQGNWGLAGQGFIDVALFTFGFPANNVTATISNLALIGGNYGTGSAIFGSDVSRNGNTIFLGGSDSLRLYNIPVSAFGPSVAFQLALNGPGVLGSGTGDGWSFSLFAADESSNIRYLVLDIPPSGAPVLDATSNFNVAVVPEPSTYVILALAVGGVVFRVRRKR